MRALLAVCFCAALFLPTLPVHAQAGGGSILWLVPPAGQIEMDRETSGTLSASDYYAPNDIYLDVWEIEGRAGASVTIDMRSDDFDAVLFITGPGLAETIWDDDSAGSCDARATVRFLEDGTYRVAATTTGSRTTGVYTLFASASPPPASAVPCGGIDPATFDLLPVAGRVTPGDPVTTGALDAGDPVLDDGAHADAWEIDGQQGVTVTIRLESDAFDSFLYVVGPGLGEILSDDDSGGELHSEIVLSFPATGVYRIIVSSVEPGGTGAYRLTVSS